MGVIRAHGSDPGEERGEGDKGHILTWTRHPHPKPAWLFQQQQRGHGGCSGQSRSLSKRVRARCCTPWFPVLEMSFADAEEHKGWAESPGSALSDHISSNSLGNRA